jgi:hypothetical protein
MKKLILTPVYPFWFLASKTWLGNVVLVFLTLALPVAMLYLILPDLIDETGELAEGIGGLLCLLTLACSPVIGIPLIKLSHYLEDTYIGWSYKTEIRFKI